MVGRPRLLAHRGASRTGPENTLEALRRCRGEGADGVELDVRLSADGEPVVFHDEDAWRLAGVRARIRDLRWRDIRRLRVFGRHRVPHLGDALAAVEAWPKAELYLDLHERRTELALAAAARVASSAVVSRTFLLAFYRERELLSAAREAFPSVRLAVMPGVPWNIGPSLRLGAKALCLGWDGDLTRWLYRAASAAWNIPSAVAHARRDGVAVSGGIGNTAEDVSWLAAQGFDAIWTDDLALARRTIG